MLRPKNSYHTKMRLHQNAFTFWAMLARERLLKIKKTLSWTVSGGTENSSFPCPANSVSMFVALAMEG